MSLYLTSSGFGATSQLDMENKRIQNFTGKNLSKEHKKNM
jgi:hypothetical protein